MKPIEHYRLGTATIKHLPRSFMKWNNGSLSIGDQFNIIDIKSCPYSGATFGECGGCPGMIRLNKLPFDQLACYSYSSIHIFKIVLGV